MSRADSTDSPRGVYVQKPKSDIYTVLLAIALVAILIACLLLFFEVRAYNYDFRAQEGKFRASLDAPVEYRLEAAPALAECGWPTSGRVATA